MAFIRNNRPSLVWLPAVQQKDSKGRPAFNPATGKAMFVKGPHGRRTKCLPGLQEIDDEVVDFAKEHSVTKFWFEGGMPYNRGPILTVEDEEPMEINEMKPKDAKALISETSDPMLLDLWSKIDDRKSVQDAIEARLEKLKAPPGSAAAAG